MQLDGSRMRLRRQAVSIFWRFMHGVRRVPILPGAIFTVLASFAAFETSLAAVGRTPGSAAVSTSGTAQYSLALALPPGRNGLTPQLGLVYDSSSGRGVAGLGWSIAGASVIARCETTVAQDGVAKAVRGVLDDGYCLDGNRLRLVSGTYGVAGSTYRTELDTFSRITAMGATNNGPAWFKAETIDGLIRYYGDTADSRIESLGTSTVRAWALSRIEDRSYNTITFTWGEDTTNGAFRLEAVGYTGSNVETAPYTVDFQYQTRADVNAGYTAGSRVQEVQRLTVVDITHLGTLVRRYALQYDVSPATARERLTSVQECAGAPLECLTPTTFTYHNGSIGFGAQQTLLAPNLPSAASAIDINGDGRDDVVYTANGTHMIAFANAAGGFNAPINTGVAMHAGSIYGDYNLDGKADILSPISGTWWVKLGTASGLAAPVNTGAPVTATGTGVNAAMFDLNADGYADLVWADLVGHQGGDAIRYRAGLATGGFSGTVQTLVGPYASNSRILAVYWGTYRKRLDFNADANRDFAVAIEYRTSTQPPLALPNEPMQTSQAASTDEQQAAAAPAVTYTYSYRLRGHCLGASWCWNGPQGPSAGNGPNFGDYNGDGKTDVFYWHQDGRYHYVFSTGVGTTSELIGPVASGYGDWTVADWDGDGFDDAITPHPGTNTWHVMRSNGVSFDTPFNTQVPFTGGASIYTPQVVDLNGDGVDDLVYGYYVGVSAHAFYYHLRTLTTAPPDMINTAEDGYGTRASFTFSPIANAAVYTKGSGTPAPTLDVAAGMWVVSRLSRTDGSGTSAEAAVDFSYVGARRNTQGRGFLGFEKRISIDRALGHDIKTIETFSQTFPTIGALTSVEVQQSAGSRISYQSNTWVAHSGGTTYQTYAYPYVSASTLDQHDLANGQKIVSIHTSATVDPTSGLVTDSTRTTTEIAGGLFTSSYKTERVQHTSVLNDTANWCLGRPTTTVATNSHTLNDGTAITRTTGTMWDAALCRVTQTTIEPGSATLQLTTTYGYDAFGNVSTQIVAGAGVASRTTTVNWGTAGRFPTMVTNALNQTTVNTWNAALAVPSSTTDPNGLTTSWQYDAFGRRTRETRPDTTYTTWTLAASGPGCDPRARYYVLETPYTTSGNAITYNYVFLDRFDRPVNEYRWSFAGNSYDTVIRSFDARGRLASEGMPYISGGCGSYSSPYVASYQYDVLNRVTQVSRPLSDSVPTLQTTYLYHEGLTTRIIDPLGKQATRTMSVVGSIARSADHNGYYQHFDYDAFANPVRVTDSLGNTLQSNTFNARGMRTAHTDMDAGGRSFVPNALGEVSSQTDAKSQTTTFAYDLLGRMTSRTELEGSSTWVWGTSAAARNIGRLQSVSGGGYSESLVYDGYGRLQTRNITSDTSYAFDYSYNTLGTLDTLTYPVSTTGNRFKLQYAYQNGRLWKVGNFASPYTTFWQANSVDAQDMSSTKSSATACRACAATIRSRG